MIPLTSNQAIVLIQTITDTLLEEEEAPTPFLLYTIHITNAIAGCGGNPVQDRDVVLLEECVEEDALFYVWLKAKFPPEHALWRFVNLIPF